MIVVGSPVVVEDLCEDARMAVKEVLVEDVIVVGSPVVAED